MSVNKKMNQAKNQVAIEVRNVVHGYAGKDYKQKLLRFDEWTVEMGEHVFLYGDSGSGKSTLLNLLSGILLPQQGTISLFDTGITKLANSARDRFRAQNIGVVFQQFNLVPYLSVLKNIELAAYLAKSPTKHLTRELDSLLNALKLPMTILNTPVANLSVGQQQRVAIMRAFINSPQLLLIDEPTSALDSTAKHAFMTHLLDMCHAHQTTLVFVSHDTGLKPFFSTQTPISALCSAVSNRETH
jgi:putative ABC transport system ATP-binding protein